MSDEQWMFVFGLCMGISLGCILTFVLIGFFR